MKQIRKAHFTCKNFKYYLTKCNSVLKKKRMSQSYRAYRRKARISQLHKIYKYKSLQQ